MCACVCNQEPAEWSDLNTMVHHRMYPDGRHVQGHMRCGPHGFLEVVVEGETITTDVPNLMQTLSRSRPLKRPAADESSLGICPKKVKLKPAAADLVGAPDIIVHRKPAAEAAPAEKAAQATEAEAAPAEAAAQAAEAEAAPAEETAQAAALQAAEAAPAEAAAQAAEAEAAPEVEAAQAAALQAAEAAPAREDAEAGIAAMIGHRPQPKYHKMYYKNNGSIGVRRQGKNGKQIFAFGGVRSGLTKQALEAIGTEVVAKLNNCEMNEEEAKQWAKDAAESAGAK